MRRGPLAQLARGCPSRPLGCKPEPIHQYLVSIFRSGSFARPPSRADSPARARLARALIDKLLAELAPPHSVPTLKPAPSLRGPALSFRPDGLADAVAIYARPAGNLSPPDKRNLTGTTCEPDSQKLEQQALGWLAGRTGERLRGPKSPCRRPFVSGREQLKAMTLLPLLPPPASLPQTLGPL